MMKKLFVTLILAAVMAAPASADFYLTGDWEGWSGGGVLMTDNMDGTYSATLSGFDGDSFHEFKVTQGDWSWNVPGSGNSWFYADGAGDVGITFTPTPAADGWLPTENRIGVNNDPGAWSIAGSLNGWSNSDAGWTMTDSGGGIYTLTKTLAAGSYDWKAVETGTWHAIGYDGRTVNAYNIGLTLDSDADVIFTIDALAGTVKAEVVPEPATMVLLGLGSLVAIRRKK